MTVPFVRAEVRFRSAFIIIHKSLKSFNFFLRFPALVPNIQTMKVVGVTGVARSGKDSFAKALINILRENAPNLSSKKYAFADLLKQELDFFFGDKFGVSCTDLPDEQKGVYRPLLVAYGKVRRDLTNNRYWLDALKTQIEIEKPSVAIVSDLRYILGENSEFDWVKNEDGLVVHVRRYEEKNKKSKDGKSIKPCKSYVKPASSDEKKQDTVLKQKADYRVVWPTYGKDEVEGKAKEFAYDFFLKNINFFIK